ncbi:MAG TPA: hypothetical protein V6C65_25505 [Allocoleopsis sp.]
MSTAISTLQIPENLPEIAEKKSGIYHPFLYIVSSIDMKSASNLSPAGSNLVNWAAIAKTNGRNSRLGKDSHPKITQFTFNVRHDSNLCFAHTGSFQV